MFSLICAWINRWVNNREAGDLRRHRAHYDVIVMCETERSFLQALTAVDMTLLSASNDDKAAGLTTFFSVFEEEVMRYEREHLAKFCPFMGWNPSVVWRCLCYWLRHALEQAIELSVTSSSDVTVMTCLLVVRVDICKITSLKVTRKNLASNSILWIINTLG